MSAPASEGTTRYYVHVAIDEGRGHLLAIQTPLPPNPDGTPSEAVRGFIHDQIADQAEWLSWMADVDHSDADGLLMAQQMQGRDDFWMEVTSEDFTRLVALGSVAGSQHYPIQGYRTYQAYGDRVALLGHGRGDPLDLTPALAGLSLDPLKRGE